MSEVWTGYAPARVNLLGEHIDYNGGTVLPAALAIGIKVSLIPSADRRVVVRSAQHPDIATRTLDESFADHWSDPALGAMIEANRMGLLSGGGEIEINSNMPAGSGLSSSAALTVALLKAARKAAGNAEPDDVALAIAARRVENDFMGVPCGIMDQMAVSLASEGQAMALDTTSLDWSLVDLPRGYTLAVIHSGITRKLTDGQYAARKAECDEAKAYFGTDDLCSLDWESVEKAKLDDKIRRRVRHCVSENARVLAAIDALARGDIEHFGELMRESHASMRDDFEMSLPAIDALVGDAAGFGAIGVRLTGGGFGGCIAAFMESESLENWTRRLLHKHPSAYAITTLKCGD